MGLLVGFLINHYAESYDQLGLHVASCSTNEPTRYNVAQVVTL